MPARRERLGGGLGYRSVGRSKKLREILGKSLLELSKPLQASRAGRVWVNWGLGEVILHLLRRRRYIHLHRANVLGGHHLQSLVHTPTRA